MRPTVPPRISALVNKNITFPDGKRTSTRMEPEFWNALTEICMREQIPRGELAVRAQAAHPGYPVCSAVVVYILDYFRSVATEEAHKMKGHGNMNWINEPAPEPQEALATCS